MMVRSSSPLKTAGNLLLLFWAVLLVGFAGHASSAVGYQGSFKLGFGDGQFLSADPYPIMADARASGASFARIEAGWGGIAPTRPTNEEDPSDPAYRFAVLDRAVIAARANRLEPIVLANSAPQWAQGVGVREPAPRTRSGAWKPDAQAFGRFGAALANRYSGSFTPGGSRVPLPRVRYFQAWNEPNINYYLSPQWEKTETGGWRSFAPSRYRSMLNKFTEAVKSVYLNNRVITAGTSPFGEEVGSWRMRPLEFWRQVFCLRSKCSAPANFDVLSSHPYSSSREGPIVDSFNPDDLPVRGMVRLVKLLRRAESIGRVRGARPHRVWATELGFETNPPDPNGISLKTQRDFAAISFYLLWKAGVDTVIWNQVVDEGQGSDFAATIQTGLFFAPGKPKPAVKAFAFPFITDPERRQLFWGVAPGNGRVKIQRRKAGGWVTVSVVKASTGSVFRGRIALPRSSIVRAVQGRHVSPQWVAR